MAQERGYERQVGTASPIALPGASAAAFGAGIGGAIAEAGDALHQADLRAYQIDRQQAADSEAASFNASFARMREEADAASVDARNRAAPGGAGHADAMRQWWQDRAKGLTEGISDDRVRRSALGQLQEFGARLGSAEYQWQEGRRVGKIVTDQTQMREAAANRARRLQDPKAFSEELSLGRQGIEALTSVPADVRDELVRDYDETVSVGFFTGLIERDPASVSRVLDTGGFDSILSPQQAERLRSGADIEIRRIAGVQKAEQAHAVTLAKEALAAERARLDTGAGTPQDWEKLAASYDGVGDASSAVTARAKGASMAAVIGHRGDTPAELDGQIAALNAKRNAGGLSSREASTLGGLTDLRGQLQGMLGQPGGALMAYQFATGRTIAPLDPNNPASMRERAAQARAAAQRYGRGAAEPILATELPAFKDMMEGGTQQRMAALSVIQGFGDPQTIRAAAAQMAGADDGAFRIASQLPLSVARDVLRGEETAKSGPKVWDDARARNDFNKWFGRTLDNAGGDYRNDVFTAARAFYSQRAVEGGEQQYKPGRFAEAIETVLGRMGSTGGIARTQRGVVLVPQGMKPDALLQRFARASDADYQRAAGGRFPRWSDGKRATAAQLKQLLPTAVDGNRSVYAFFSGGRPIYDDKGIPFVIDLNQLPQ